MSRADEERAMEIHHKSIVINMLDPTTIEFDRGYCDTLRTAGITALNECININVNMRPWEGLPEVTRQFYTWYNRFEKDAGKILHVQRAEDIERAKKENRTGVIFGFQNPHPIDEDLNLLKVFYRLGLRICGISYIRRNSFADGGGEKTNVGLSRLGEVAVEECNKQGVLIDLSHASDQSSMDVLELSKDPVCFTHSGARSVCNHMRNIKDEQIQTCAEKGGVIGVCAFAPFLHEKGRAEGAKIEHIINHIKYVIDLVGVDHVGIGSDSATGRTAQDVLDLAHAYPELEPSPKPLDLDGAVIAKRYALPSHKFPDLTRGLVARGYSDEEISKILGGNFLRLFKKVWK